MISFTISGESIDVKESMRPNSRAFIAVILFSEKQCQTVLNLFWDISCSIMRSVSSRAFREWIISGRPKSLASCI